MGFIRKIKLFPDITLANGDFVLVHWDSTGGTPDENNGTGKVDTKWDVYTKQGISAFYLFNLPGRESFIGMFSSLKIMIPAYGLAIFGGYVGYLIYQKLKNNHFRFFWK